MLNISLTQKKSVNQISEQSPPTIDELREWAEAEREGSAIDPDVWDANVKLVMPSWQAPLLFLGEAIERKQRVKNYITAEAARLVRRYAHLEHGYWMIYGEEGDVPYAKPYRPRINQDGKVIKYENPPGLPATPVLPWMAGVSWADVKADPRIPVAVVEGAKKAMALISFGLPAVGIRGITQWHAKDEKDPWPVLVELVRGGREIYLFPDQDQKIRTRSDVYRQNLKLGVALERWGARVRLVEWDPGLGKGIDDVLAGLGARAMEWLDEAVATARGIRELRRAADVAKARRVVLSDLGDERQVVRGFLPQVELRAGEILALDAPMGTGKTTRIGEMARQWIAEGGQVAVFSPLNSLGQQTAERWDLPHVHDYSPRQASILRADVTARGGVVACINSIERVVQALDPNRSLLVVIDEANQTLLDAVEGGTLKNKWSPKLKEFTALLQRASTVVLSEHLLRQDTVALVHALAGMPVRWLRYTRWGTPWPVRLYDDPDANGLRTDVIERLQAGERVLLLSTSQRECARWELWAQEHGIHHARIDGETNENGAFDEFFRDPNSWLEKERPQLLIASPSVKTGVSIEALHFDLVVGVFPALDSTTALQLLGRYRPTVERWVWRPVYVPLEPDDQANRLRVFAALRDELQAYGGDPKAMENPWMRFYTATRARKWAEKIAARESLVWLLEHGGHRVERVTRDPEVRKAIGSLWGDYTERVEWEWALRHAQVEADEDVEWAMEVLDSLEASVTARLKAHKILVQNEFPGARWDAPELWLAHRKYRGKAMRVIEGAADRQTRQTAMAEDARKVLDEELTPVHRLPRKHADYALAKVFLPLVRPLIEAGRVDPMGQAEARVVEVAWYHERLLARYWGIHLKKTDSVTSIVNRILRKLGVTPRRERLTTVAPRVRLWTYTLWIQPEFLELLEAYWRGRQQSGKWQAEPGWDPIPEAFYRLPRLPAYTPPGHGPPA
jgi:tRNA A37 threonylcarbamoyladenosine biosynthesis protein TsaE